MLIPLKNAGDTIVEVLIAIVILSLALSLSYVVVIKSSSNTEVTDQRDIALGLAQSQVEFLRAYYQTNNGTEPTFGSANYHCFNSLGAASTSCLSSSGLFTTTITQAKPVGALSYIYTIQVQWNHEVVGGNNYVTLYYQTGT